MVRSGRREHLWRALRFLFAGAVTSFGGRQKLTHHVNSPHEARYIAQHDTLNLFAQYVLSEILPSRSPSPSCHKMQFFPKTFARLPKDLYICSVFRKEAQHLICSISHPNCYLEKEIKEPNLTIVGAAPNKCRLHHRLLEVVADLDESMEGLHFLSARLLVLAS